MLALTAASRCTYAFARDGAIPGSRLWRKVDKRFDIPLWGLVLWTLVDCLLGLIYFGSSAAFNSFTGVVTICLLTSYGLPIPVSVLRRRKMVKNSSFSQGKFGFAINILAICWICLAVVLFCMLVSLPVQAQTVTTLALFLPGLLLLVSFGTSFVGERDSMAHRCRRMLYLKRKSCLICQLSQIMPEMVMSRTRLWSISDFLIGCPYAAACEY